MARYASGSRAIAICDRCGLQYPYNQISKLWTGLRVCPECWEAKHPQLDPIYPPPEPQALYQPRPANKEVMSVPVGQDIFPFIDNISTQGVMQIGIVRVEIS